MPIFLLFLLKTTTYKDDDKWNMNFRRQSIERKKFLDICYPTWIRNYLWRLCMSGACVARMEKVHNQTAVCLGVRLQPPIYGKVCSWATPMVAQCVTCVRCPIANNLRICDCWEQTDGSFVMFLRSLTCSPSSWLFSPAFFTISFIF